MRRNRRGRRRKISPVTVLVLLTAVAAVVWLIVPHRPQHLRRETKPIAEASPVPTLAPPPTPRPRATPAPSAAPTALPSVAAPLPSGGKPAVAIVIDDCGQWLSTERGYIALPIPLTLAVLPYVRYTSLIAREAAAAGKGVMLHLPMEPISHIYPGPGEITTAMTDAQVAAQTEDDIAQVPLAAGVNNHEGSQATSDPRVMRAVMAVLKRHGLFFVDSMTIATSVGVATARRFGVPTAARDVFLDDRRSVAYTQRQLQIAVDIAKANGSAIAIGHPRPTTLEALREMYPKMEAEGVRFVLVQQLVH